MVVEPREVFANTVGNQGEGYLIAMKIALQAFAGEKKLLVFSPGSMAENAGYLGVSSLVSSDPLATARGLARASKQRVLIFSGDIATESCIESFRNIDESVTYICCNNAGSSSSGSRNSLEKQLARLVSAMFVATASVAFPEDYMRKLLKARQMTGFSFIEVHCPSPKLWGFDPSNTIEVGRVAVNSYVWPLLEITNGTLSVSYRPEQQESAEIYARIQSRFSEGNIGKIKNRAAENMKLLSSVK